MFKFKPNPTFTATVCLSIPGVEQPQPVQMTFVHKTKTQLEKLFNAIDKDTPVLDTVRKVLDGWAMESDGVTVDFTDHNLGLLLDNYPAAAIEIILAYKREMAEAKTKN